MLFAIAAIIAIVQLVAVSRRPELKPFFPAAAAATAVALLSGVFLALGAEFGWISNLLLDDLTLPVMIAALWWSFYNRLGSRRNRTQSS